MSKLETESPNLSNYCKIKRFYLCNSKNQNPRVVNRLLAFISTTMANLEVFYDSREEATDLVSAYLKNSINSLESLPNNGGKLDLLVNVDPTSLVLYSELFRLYLRNSYNRVNPVDLVKISSWLNEQWNNYLEGSLILFRMVFTLAKIFDRKLTFRPTGLHSNHQR